MRFKYCLFVLIAGGFVALLPAQRSAAATINLNPSADTSLHSAFPNSNFGGGTTFTSGGRNMGGTARALLQFDIAGNIPAGATINSAALTLTVTAVNGPGSTFELRRILAAWGEGTGQPGMGSPATAGEATWNHRLAPDTAWSNAGGDFGSTTNASQVIAGAGPYSFASEDLAADVQQWLDDPETNFGWLLRSQSESTPGTIRRFAGRLDSINPPVLEINYTLPVSPATPPRLFDVALVDSQIRFSFNAESNRTYTVDFRDTLGTTNWSELTSFPAEPADTTIHITNDVAGDERYFRAWTP
jgi:hypothetical protein